MAKAKQVKSTRRVDAGIEEAAAGGQSTLQAAFDAFERLPVPMFFKDRDGRYLAVNRAWEELFGLKRESFLGKQVSDLYPQNPDIARIHAARDRELWEKPGSQSYQIPIITPDGRSRETIYYKATFPGGLVGAIFDVTARARAEAALRESEERFRTVVDSANEGMLVYDRSLNVIAGNRAAERILGLPLSRVIGQPGFTSLMPCIREDGTPIGPNDRPTKLTVRSGKPQTGIRVGIERPDGARRWVSVNTAFLHRGDDTGYYGLVSTITDITESRDAEARLKESEARFRRTFELAGSGLAHVGMDGRFLRVNSSLCQMLGYTEQELVGLSVRDISHPEDRDAVDPQRERLLAGEVESARLEKRYVRKDGSVMWASLTIAFERDAAGEPQYAISVLDDITTRRGAEERVRESEARFRRTFELAGSGMAHISMERRFIRVNRRLCEILGYPEHELLGLTGRQISHPDDLDIINEQRPALYAGEIDAVRLEKRYLKKDRSVVWVKFTMTVERDAGGKPLYEIAVYDDITAQRDAEERVRESEARFRQTFELAASGICHVVDGRFTKVNKALCDILGYPEKELLGKHVKDVSHPDDRNVTDAARGRIRAGEIESARFEKRYIRGDNGAVVWCDIGITLVRDVFGLPQYEVAIFDDITPQKDAEAALRAAHEELQRSNSELEQFAYVASHDLQEPLRMVASYTQLLQRRYDAKLDNDAREFMAYVVDGATRMKQLIEDLLAYSRVGTKGKDFKPVASESALRRALFNLRAAIEESGAVVTNDDMPTLDADEMQLAQLFQNLMGNALKFRSDSVPRIHVSVKEQEAEWEFEVRDNGIGIEPQYYERIFMVFQRLHNKGEYPGTGIGLAICKKVVERHGGRIWVTSKPGEGSSFHFTLPKQRGDS
jgi:PAS domain S-box-containing protein